MSKDIMEKLKTQKCRSCGAEIIWIKTAATESWIPLNAKPQRLMVLQWRHKTNHTGAATPEKYAVAVSETCFTPHHATCPQAKEWKK